MGSHPCLHGDRLYAEMPGGIGGMGSRLRGNNGRRAARFLEGLGMTGGAAFRMTWGGCAGNDVGREERRDGFPPPSSPGQALRGNAGWDWGNGFPPPSSQGAGSTREQRQAGGEIPRGTRNDRGRCAQNDMGGALGMMCGGRKEGMGSRPRLNRGRLYAGMPGGIGGMGSRLRGNNGRRAARFLEGLGMTGGAALRMTWGEERGDGFPPPSSPGQALCGKNGWAREWWWAGGSRTAPTDCYQPGLERHSSSLFS